MTLSQRTILIVVSTFIALLFILAVTSDVILLKSFAELERVVVADNVQKVRNEIDESYDELLASSNEIGAIISEQENSYLKKISVASLKNHHVDIVMSFSQDSQVTASLVADKGVIKSPTESKRVFTELSTLVPLVQKSSDNSLQGLILVGAMPLQLVMSQLPDKSILLVGRFLDEREINRITALTEFVLELVPLSELGNTPDVKAALAAISRGDDNHVQVNDQDTVAGYTLYNDLLGRPALLVKITEERLLYEQGKVSIIYVLCSLFIAGGVFCSVMLIFIRGTILNRLATLSQKVSQITSKGDITERLPVSQHEDELNDLAVSINSMLDSLGLAEKDLRESEERYRMLFERAPDAIIIVGVEDDELGKIMAANQAAADQHGYSVDELVKLSMDDLNTPESKIIYGANVTTILTGKWLTSELWHLKKDGTSFPLEVHAGLIKIGGKKYMLGFDRDITQRKITEETDNMHLEQIHQLNIELNRKARDLVAANNELEAFNYSVSHDMRGPLTQISGYCQLILDENNSLDPAIKDYISRIYESETWLNEMIDALLHLGKLTRTELVSGSVNLSAIAESVLNELALENPQRTVRTRIEPDIIVAGDCRLLKMVMINLLGNAWKYSSNKSAAVIEFGVEMAESGPVYFVRDNGAGFDMNDVDKLFRVFSRLHDAAQFTGTGIGLATVQRIILRHGGRIRAEGEPGIGATFYFTLL